MSTANTNDGNATETAIENEDGNVNAESTTKDDTDYKAKYDKVVADNQKLAMSVEEKTLKSKTKIRKALDGMDEADLKELGYVSSETSEQRSARVAQEATDAEKATSQKALQATQAAAMGISRGNPQKRIDCLWRQRERSTGQFSRLRSKFGIGHRTRNVQNQRRKVFVRIRRQYKRECGLRIYV